MLSPLLYRFSLQMYQAGIGVAALLGKAKARKWLAGRKDWRSRLKASVAALPEGPRIWLHAASLGEFEQGRPVLEALQQKHPGCQLILTFFSPSGYEPQKNFKAADIVAYLPADSPHNARDFLDLVQPAAALFVKYEFWYYFLQALHQRHIPTLLFSAAFRQDQPFFKGYGGLFRQMLNWYDTIQVQDAGSLSLLRTLQPQAALQLGGDTRYDRVLGIAAEARAFDKLVTFKENSFLLIAGSTWPADEQLLHAWLVRKPAHWKLVLAPHEIDEAHLQSIEKLFAGKTVRYSNFTAGAAAPVLIIDNIGMLSALYRYGEVAFVGGGFARSGIHNVLEPAVFGLPVLMGPHYQKFSEARLLVEKGFARPVQNILELEAAFRQFSESAPEMRPRIRAFLQAQAGATKAVLAWLQGVLKQ